MTDLSGVTAWIDGYVRAWSSNDPGEIGALFTADADYHRAPYEAPVHGRDRIVDDGVCSEFTEWWMQHPATSDAR